MPVYKTPNGTWRVRVVRKGIRRDIVVKGTESEAKAAYHKLLAEMISAPAVVTVPTVAKTAPRAVPTFSEFVESQRYKQHLSDVMPRKNGKSLANRLSNLRKLTAALGAKRLDTISASDIELYQQDRKQSVKAITVNSEILALVSVLNYAKDYCGFPITVPKYRQLKDHSTDTTAVKLWTDTQVRNLLTACQKDGPDLGRLVRFLALTGCRKEEALRLKWSSLDFERKTIRIEGSEDGSYRTKSGRFRTLSMGTALESLLTDTPHWNPEFVFVSSVTMEPWAAFPQNRFDRCAKLAGCDGGPHTLRHTYASKFLASVADIFLLQQVLGHADVKTTQRYSHLIPDHLARARDAVSF